MLNVPVVGVADANMSRILAEINRRGARGDTIPILRRWPVTITGSSVVINTVAETNYDVNKVISNDLMRSGYIIAVHAAGLYSNGGAGTHTIRFRMKFGTTNLLVFDALTITGTNTTAPWGIEATVALTAVGSSGLASCYGYNFIAHGGATKTIFTDIQMLLNTAVNTLNDQTLQISVQHGVANLFTNSLMVGFVLDIMQ